MNEIIDNDKQDLINEGELGADYIEQLLDILDYDGDVDIDVIGNRAHISIIGGGEELNSLVGEKGEVLDSLQELTRLAIQNEQGQPSLLMLDIANYRKDKKVSISQEVVEIAKDVISQQKSHALSPMSAFERKIVHDTVAQIPGVRSESDGVSQNRHVIIFPDNA